MSSARAVHVLRPHLCLSKDKRQGRTNQLDSLTLLCEMVERGSKVGMIIKVGLLGYPLSCVPIQGKKDRGRPIQATFPFPGIGLAETRKE